MSIEQMVKVLHNSRSKGSDRLVLLAMANEAHSTGELTAYGRSMRWLARLANVSERQTSRSIDALVELGEVQVLAKGTGRMQSDYLLTVPEEPLPAPPPRPRSNLRDDSLSALNEGLRDDNLSSLGGQAVIPGRTDCHPRDDEESAPSSRSSPVSPVLPPSPPPANERATGLTLLDSSPARSARKAEKAKRNNKPGQPSSSVRSLDQRARGNSRARDSESPSTSTDEDIFARAVNLNALIQTRSPRCLSNDQRAMRLVLHDLLKAGWSEEQITEAACSPEVRGWTFNALTYELRRKEQERTRKPRDPFNLLRAEEFPPEEDTVARPVQTRDEFRAAFADVRRLIAATPERK